MPSFPKAIQDSIWHPYTRFSTLEESPAPVIVRGEGPFLFDNTGRRYFDAISSWWACALGHGHPRVVGAIQRQAGMLQHSILGNLSHPPALALAARLAGWFPEPGAKVLFASDGSSAVEAAIKIALQYAHDRKQPSRRVVVSLRGAYHGDTLGAVAAGFLDEFHAPYRHLIAPGPQLPVPCSAAEEPAALEAARAIFARHRGEIAALIVEPMCLGAAGMILYRAEYLRALRELAAEAGALFVADEIAVGLGRTGRRLACDHAGIQPDIVCLGKALTAGYLPLSATVVRRDIFEAFTDRGPTDCTFYHGHTFSGNPIAAAAALAALDVYEEEDLFHRAQRLGPRMGAALETAVGWSCVKEVRQLGMIGAVELREDSVPLPRDQARPARVRRALLERDVLARPLGRVVYVMPPLNIRESDLDELLRRVLDAIRAAG